MKLEVVDIELLETYWRGELEEAARHALEERLLKDVAFQEAATELEQLQKGLHELQLRHWRSQLTQLEQKAPPIVLTKPTWWRRYGWVLMAGVLLLALLFLLWFSASGDQEPAVKPQLTPGQAVAKANFEPYPYLGQKMDHKLAEAAILYQEKKDYAKAEIALLALFQETRDSSKLMYAAISAIGNNEGERVIPILKQMVNSGKFESVYLHLKLYLALAYLQADSFAESQKILKELAALDDPLSEKAQVVLTQIADLQNKIKHE